MQAARGAVKDLREKGKQFVKPKYADSLLGSGLEEQIRRATAKTLPGPDLALNRRIVETINTDLNEYSAHQLASVLKSRLSLKNAHKQWLAIELVQEILEGCPKVVEAAKGEILEDVAQIAAQPMNRYGSDLPGQQHCKNASFALLKKYGHEGQDAMRDAVGLPSMVRADSDDSPHLSRLGQSRKSLSNRSSAAGAPSSSDNSFPAVRERVQMGIATSQSHSEVLQDMVLNLSSAEGKRDIEHEKNVLKDLVKEMVQFRNKFEQTLEMLSQYETHEAQSLMTEALEAMDMMNNSIVLQNEVLTARKNTRQNSYGRSSSAGSSSSAAPRLAPPPGSVPVSGMPASPRGTQNSQPAAPAEPAAPSYLDILSELQTAMERPTTGFGSSAPQSNDPFAASYANPSGQAPDQYPQPLGQQYPPGSGTHADYANQPQYQQQQPAQTNNPFALMGDHAGPPQSAFGSSGPNATSYVEPSMSRMTSTSPLASAASLAPQQNCSQSNQGNLHQQGQGYQQPSQGNYQQQGQGTYPQTNQAGRLQPQQGAFQQPHQGTYQQSIQETNQQPQQGSYQQPNQANSFPQTGQSQPSRQFPGQQNLGPRTPNTSAEDPFAHLPYPELNKPFPRKPERAPAPPLSSYSSASQLAQQQEQQRQQAQQQLLQQHQQQRQAAPAGNAWSQAHPDEGAAAGGSFGFDENAFGGVQASMPEQAVPERKERPRNLYINSLYNEEPGAEGQVPAGFQPPQQVLSRGTGSWGMGSPVTTPNKGGVYTGDSGPPTPEGLQYQNHNSAGSSLATTPAAQHVGNSEWDMFFADRIRGNGAANNAAPQQMVQQPASQIADPFDELTGTRAR